MSVVDEQEAFARKVVKRGLAQIPTEIRDGGLKFLLRWLKDKNPVLLNGEISNERAA